MTIALLGLSIPEFWLGLVLIWSSRSSSAGCPTGGYVPLVEDPIGWLRTSRCRRSRWRSCRSDSSRG